MAALVAIDEMTIDIGDAGGSMSRTFRGSPFYFSGFHFDTDGVTAIVLVAAIDVAVDEDHAAVVVLEGLGLEEVYFFCNRSAPFGDEFEKR